MPNTIPSTMNANKVGTPIRTEILFNRIQVRITTTMRMRKSVVIVYPKQMIPAAKTAVRTAISCGRNVFLTCFSITQSF